jgi:alanine racemase
VVGALEPLDPWGYGLATANEALALRAQGITRPLVVFTPLLPDPATIAACRGAKVRPVIGDLAALEGWLTAGGGPFHVELDTGLNRSGFSWRDRDALTTLASRIRTLDAFEGIFTHFHSPDADPASVRTQLERLHATLSYYELNPPLLHYSNSASAGIGLESHAELARPGIYLYGGEAGTLRPEPVAALRARVVAVRRVPKGDSVSYGGKPPLARDSRIATLAIGYADGVPRSLSGRGKVELAGVSMPIVGRVTMDMLMLDAGDHPVAPGDVATVFGGLVSLEEQAVLAGTVSYELLTRITPRIPRLYREP